MVPRLSATAARRRDAPVLVMFVSAGGGGWMRLSILQQSSD